MSHSRRKSGGHSDFEYVQKKLVSAAGNPRDKAFIDMLGKTGMQITEAIHLEESNIDFERGTITIAHLMERLELKCPDCGEILGKRYVFCPSCGNKVSQAIREEVVQQRRQRLIPVDRYTLRLLSDYFQWRRQFPYRGSLVFPFSRQRGWQLVEKIGRRAGIKRLNPSSLRRLLTTAWLAKGLDPKKLQMLLGQASISATMAYTDAEFKQLRSEYEQLWEGQESGTAKHKDEKVANGYSPPRKRT
jgi:site-specific recombinase XerD